MTTAIEKREQQLPDMLEQVIMAGDLAQLSPADRLNYYGRVCESLGLNPLTKPFQYIRLNGKLTLYASKDATEQLARIHNVSIYLSEGKVIEDIYIVNAEASTSERRASASGAVSITGLAGENKANAFMKAETKACRRAVLRLVGLGWLDESETDSISGASLVDVNADTGELVVTKTADEVYVGRALPPQQSEPPKGWQEFLIWLDGYGNTLDDVSAVIEEEATLQTVGAYMRQHGLNGKEFQDYLIAAWSGQAEEPPEFLDGIPPAGSAPNPNLPSAPISE